MDVFRLIFEKAEDKNPAEENGLTPLHIAADRNLLEICRLIMEKAGNKNPANERGITPLHSLTICSNPDGCSHIINDSIDFYNVNGKTPKDLAKEKHHLEIIELFESYDTGAAPGLSEDRCLAQNVWGVSTIFRKRIKSKRGLISCFG